MNTHLRHRERAHNARALRQRLARARVAQPEELDVPVEAPERKALHFSELGVVFVQSSERAHRVDGLLGVGPTPRRSALQREELPEALLRRTAPLETEVEARHPTEAARGALEEHE